MSHPEHSANTSPLSPTAARRLAELQPIATLAKILQKAEAGGYEGHARQYQHVANELAKALAKVEPDATLYAILEAFPAAADLYENVRYEHAGLCLHDMDKAIQAETLTTDLLKGLAEH
jgi:hemoglobin-like flavoprotein